MPRTPRLRSGTQPVQGSVGRLRVGAPVEAFGGGQGLQRLGAGISNLGGGVRAFGEEQDRQAKIDKVKKDKLAADRALFEIQKAQAERAATDKRRVGTEAMNAGEQYKEFNEKLIDEKTKGLPEDVRESVKLSAERNGFNHGLSVSAYERTEIERVNKNNASANLNAAVDNAAISIGKLEGFQGNYNLYKETYEAEMLGRFVEWARLNGIEGEARDQAWNKVLNKSDRMNFEALLANMAMDDSADVVQLEENVKQVIAMSKDENLSLTTEDLKALDARGKQIVEGRKAEIRRAEIELKRKEDAERVERVNETVGLLKDEAPEEQMAGLHVQELFAEDKEEKEIYRKMRLGIKQALDREDVNNVRAQSSLWVWELNTMKAEGASPDTMKAYLTERAGSGFLTMKDYHSMRQTIGQNLDSRTTDAYNKAKPMVKKLIEDNEKLQKLLPGGFLKDKDARQELEPSVAFERAQAVSRILNELQLYFTKTNPNGKATDGVAYIEEYLKPFITDTAKDDLMNKLRNDELTRIKDAISKRAVGMDKGQAQRIPEMTMPRGELLGKDGLDVTKEEE